MTLSARLLRLVCSLALGLALVGQLTAVFHMGLVRHGVCVEHGELVELTRGDGRVHTAPGLDDVSSRASADDDQHCLAASMTRSLGALAPAAAPVPAIAASTWLPVFAPVLDEVVPGEVLSVAPKHGPPTLEV